MEVHALRSRGWSISAIARHTGRDRKTIRRYLSGQAQPGVRAPAGEDPFETVVPYVAQRLSDDAHVMATALYAEVVALGYPRSYATFTRQLRDRALRPVCPACTSSSSRTPTIEIVHPPGEETQWDWVDLPEAPWLDGGTAHVLVGALAHSGKFRGVIAEAIDQPHTLDAINRIVAGLGGTTRRWRFDRMGTVVEIGTDRVLPSFAAFAKHYAVAIDICPAYRAKRKGAVGSPHSTLEEPTVRPLRTYGPALFPVRTNLTTTGGSPHYCRDFDDTAAIVPKERAGTMSPLSSSSCTPCARTFSTKHGSRFVGRGA